MIHRPNPRQKKLPVRQCPVDYHRSFKSYRLTGANQELSIPTHATTDFANMRFRSIPDPNLIKLQASFAIVCLLWLYVTHCYVSGQVQMTLRTASDTDMLFKAAKKPMDLFPRVPRIDSILFTVPVTAKCVSSLPKECKMTTLMIDGSNVSTSHSCRRFQAMICTT